MESSNRGASDAPEAEDIDFEQVVGDGGPTGDGDAEEMLGDELAAFAFLREEDDREVRLSFRDVPADSIANAFRRSGALFISLTGERLRTAQAASVNPVAGEGSADEGVPQPGRRRRKRKADRDEVIGQADPGRTTGELVMRYFYATENLVYTVIIATSTGIIKSIAGVYPSAQLSEQEVRRRLGVVVR